MKPVPKKFADSRVFMNTRINMQVYSVAGTIETRNAIEKAYEQFQLVVDKYTRFNAESELSRLNNSVKERPYPVSKELFSLLETMLAVAAKTDYMYDPTVIDYLETYGYNSDYDFAKLENKNLYSEIEQIRCSRNHPKQIILDKQARTVTLQKRQRLDLGSIGKGFAIDLAAMELQDFPSFLINAGGDLRVKGTKPDGEPWQLALAKTPLPGKHTTEQQTIGKVSLKNGALAGSGGYARKIKFFHHLINPATGTPANTNSQTYVYGKSAMLCDVYATVLFLGGEEFLPLLGREGYSGLLIKNSGEMIVSETFPDIQSLNSK